MLPCRRQVTKKDKEAETQWMLFRKALTVTWPHLTYYVAFAAGVIYFIVTAALGEYRRVVQGGALWSAQRAACRTQQTAGR
jgi:hypothetical protein